MLNDNTLTLLKSALFSHAYTAFESYRRLKAEEPSCDWSLERRTFLALWGVIEAAGLEEEYYEWKESPEHD